VVCDGVELNPMVGILAEKGKYAQAHVAIKVLEIFFINIFQAFMNPPLAYSTSSFPPPWSLLVEIYHLRFCPVRSPKRCFS
jgi:hypothetical protein